MISIDCFFFPLSFGSFRGCIFCCHHETNQVATGEHALADDDVFDPKAVADESSKAACRFMPRCGNGQLTPAFLWSLLLQTPSQEVVRPLNHAQNTLSEGSWSTRVANVGTVNVPYIECLEKKSLI